VITLGSGKIPKSEEIKLWAKAAGVCAFPDCQSDLLNEWPGGILGNKAHIVAQSKKGPRGHVKLLGDVHSHQNLVLLCAHHHQLVDSDPEKFTVETLRQIKLEHDQKIEGICKRTRPWKRRWHMIHYMNLPRLSMLADDSEKPFNVTLPEGFKALCELGWDLGYVIKDIQRVFEQIEVQAVRLRSLVKLDSSMRGGFVYFSERYYAKNVPTPDAAMAGSVLTGRIEKDPHIHFKWAGYKIILPIEPRWITTSTAFGDFCHRGFSSEVLSGIFQVKSIDQAKALVVGSPLLLGVRLSPCIEVVSYGTRPASDYYDEHEDYDEVKVAAAPHVQHESKQP
jgi:hypothetical protein